MAIKNMTLGDSSTTVNLTANGNVVGTNIKNKGSATQPVYFDTNGVAQSTTYTLGKSVPSNAKFTDTTYGVVTASANGLMSSTDKSKFDKITFIDKII